MSVSNFESLVWNHNTEIKKKIEPGSLLLSEPFLNDPNFKRAVVFLTEHDEENGSLGFILNRPLEMELGEVVEGWEDSSLQLYLGGPVQHETLHYLHTLGSYVSNSVEVAKGLYWGGELEEVFELVKSGIATDENFRFFLGYSGWGYEQLLDEIKEGSWIVHKGKAEHVFGMESDTLWKSILESMGTIYKVLSNYPEDPYLN